MKIYDCFTYFNEDQLLKLRLETLWDVVDTFVICEATRTHTGKEKGKNFNFEKFEKYSKKIRYLLIDTFPFKDVNPWVYENYQRNYLINGLYDAQSSDWVMVSDLDEIPNPDSIHSFNPNLYLRASFEQYAHIYFLNNRVLRNGKPLLWYLPKITTYENLVNVFGSCEEVRNYRSKGFWRGINKTWMKLRTQIIPEGGWHFTWMGGVERILLKMDSMAHQELNKPEFRNPELIKQKIMSGGDIFGERLSGGNYGLVELDGLLPSYLSLHPYEFGDLILKPEMRTL